MGGQLSPGKHHTYPQVTALRLFLSFFPGAIYSLSLGYFIFLPWTILSSGPGAIFVIIAGAVLTISTACQA